MKLKEAAKWTAGRAGAALYGLLGSRAGGAFGILAYHRVAPGFAGVPVPTWNVAPRRFAQQIAGLLARGFQPWPLRKLLVYSAAGLPVPPKTFVVTFDDGFENVFTAAFPVLKDYSVPATVFLATAYLDSLSPFPCDDWPAAGSPRVPGEAWRPLSTAQCDEMLASGLVEIGSHTHTHADFRGRPGAFRQDVAASLDVLRRRFGLADATLAFPFGFGALRDGPELATAARSAGVHCALTTERELVAPGDDPFQWGRFVVEPFDTAATLAGKLGGWYGAVCRLGSRTRAQNLPSPASGRGAGGEGGVPINLPSPSSACEGHGRETGVDRSLAVPEPIAPQEVAR